MGLSIATSSLGSASFRPVNIANCILWLRGDKGITLDGSSNVQTWADQSGAGNTVTQGTAASRPAYNTSQIGGQKCVNPNGTSSVLQTAGNISAFPLTAFAVAKATTQGATQRAIFGGTAGNNHILYENNGGQAACLFGGSAGNTGAQTLTNPHVWMVTVNGASSTIGIDGAVTAATLASAAVDPLTVCADLTNSIFWDGPIAEIIWYSRLLTAREQSIVSHYLGSRYGIAVSN